MSFDIEHDQIRLVCKKNSDGEWVVANIKERQSESIDSDIENKMENSPEKINIDKWKSKEKKRLIKRLKFRNEQEICDFAVRSAKQTYEFANKKKNKKDPNKKTSGKMEREAVRQNITRARICTGIIFGSFVLRWICAMDYTGALDVMSAFYHFYNNYTDFLWAGFHQL